MFMSSNINKLIYYTKGALLHDSTVINTVIKTLDNEQEGNIEKINQIPFTWYYYSIRVNDCLGQSSLNKNCFYSCLEIDIKKT